VRSKWIEHLISFYVTRSFKAGESIGLISGQAGEHTYVAEGVNGALGSRLIKQIKDQYARKVVFERDPEDASKTRLIFDAAEHQYEEICLMVP